MRRDEPCFLEDAQVLHHAEARHLERALDLAERSTVSLEEAVEDRPPGRIRERPEDGLVGRLKDT
jgi:hypothetical protein